MKSGDKHYFMNYFTYKRDSDTLEVEIMTTIPDPDLFVGAIAAALGRDYDRDDDQ